MIYEIISIVQCSMHYPISVIVISQDCIYAMPTSTSFYVLVSLSSFYFLPGKILYTTYVVNTVNSIVVCAPFQPFLDPL